MVENLGQCTRFATFHFLAIIRPSHVARKSIVPHWMFQILLRGTNQAIIMAKLSCRFYEHKFPEQEDVVMVKVRDIAEMGAYVHLLEYNNIEGMVLLSELSRRRIRSINKLIRIGRDECVVVIRVDKDKGGC